METSESKILNSYLKLLERLSPRLKLELIEKLTQSIKLDLSKDSRMKSSFGAWESENTAEELIDQIRSSKYTNRQIEEL